MSSRRFVRRALVLDEDDEDDVVYSFTVLLPNSTSVPLTVTNPEREMPMGSFVNLVKEEYEKARKDCLLMTKRTRVDWNLGGKFLLESDGERMKGVVRFAAFKPNSSHIIRLDDGSGVSSTMYENLWDLTPDTDLLKEQPENYTFETALADLIDNSLQAVWSCSTRERKLISVDVSANKISVFDTGRGMDSSEENAIVKWGKIGGSLHRSEKTLAIGGSPPYLKPFFGMFGYGGPYACMFLGKRTLVSAKTKESKKVFTLHYEQEALTDNHSVSGKNWKTSGGMRDPTEEENKLSPRGSFTKVEIFESEFDMSKIYQLQCRLKDIYFPYIQCDELSETGRTERPVEFQVSGEDLAEIAGGEVAITNLNSKGEEFSFQIRFSLTSEKRKGRPQEANARLKFVYFPIVQGKESIEKILEGLAQEGCEVSENFQTFGRVSVRRLGRLLPEVRWGSIPFMQKGFRASTLEKSCRRVKCFIDLDAGFSPTPSKTDLASQNPFSVALRNFGSKPTNKEKDTDVKMVIRREGKQLGITQLDQNYQDWVMKMHDAHDEEATSGEDEGILVLESLDKKALGILRDAVRVHKVVKRKGKLWKRGQKIKILSGAYAGVHNGNVYATIDYFLIEGFEDEAGGDTRILCRPIDCPEKEGCKLSCIDESWRLELKKSLSLPITLIDSGKCLHADAEEWTRKLEKKQEKAPSRIDLLEERDCRELNIDGELPVSVRVGRAPPQQIVAVIRPACFTSPSKKLEQKHIVNMEGKEMVMVVKLADPNTKPSAKVAAKSVCSQRLFPTSRKGIGGLYIFSLGSKFPNLFKRAGTYNFSFSIGGSITCSRTVVVKPSSKAAKWKLDESLDPQPWNVRVGSCLKPFGIACLDEYGNQIQFTSVPSLEVELKANSGFQLKIDDFEANLIDGGSTLMIKEMLVETDGLDKISPNYDATLEIRAQDKPLCVTIACKLNPGPLERVEVNNLQAFENLLPGSTVENLILEMFDGFNNHVAEGTTVLINTDGYRIEDWMGADRKVDGRGCIDLSGILKVTEGYGKHVSFSVVSDSKEIFRKESQIEERELRLVTELPGPCTAGSNLTNLIFKVTDSDGSMDTSIHHDEKTRCSHTLSVESDSSRVESGIRYAFVHGSCKVPSLSLPETDGIFSFKVFHSRYPELHVDLKILITPPPAIERDDNIGCSTPYSRMTSTPQSGMASTTNRPGVVTPTPGLGLERTPCSQFGVLAIRSPSLDGSCPSGVMDIVQYTQSLKQELSTYKSQQEEKDERLKCLVAEQEQADQELITLQASLDSICEALPECLSTRESMMKHIEEEHQDTAASVFCSLTKDVPPPRSWNLSNRGVFGIVALLGSVASTSLSRVLSAYLGKDTMLALVCKSSEYSPSFDEYLKLQAEAARLRRPITNPLQVICLDATRTWRSGLVENDPQRRLAMVNPSQRNGDPIPGFKGYAVNMIELALGDLDIGTKSGHGLRETLFYELFGDLQVYETGKDLEAALSYLVGVDAVSLDGVIKTRKGFLFSGSCIPEVHFPITVPENHEKTLLKLEITREKKRKREEEILKEEGLLKKIGKKLKKATQKYKRCTAMSESQDI